MLHLGVKTYMQLDKLIDMGYDRVVISADHGYPVADSIQSTTGGDLIHYGTMIENLIGPYEGCVYSSYPAFFKAMFERNSNQVAILIYADISSFMKLASAWYKILFVNIDGASAYRLIKAHFERQLLIGPRQSRDARFIFSDFRNMETEFIEVFNSVTVDATECSDLLNTYIEEVSIEYLLASYAYNGSQKEMLKKSLLKIAGRTIEEQTKEILYAVYKNILRKSFQDSVGTPAYTIDNVGNVLTDPMFASLIKANNWRATTATPETPRPPFDLSTFSDEEIANLKTSIRAVIASFYPAEMAEHYYEHNRLYYIDYLRHNTLSDADFETIINFDVQTAGDEQRFFSAKDNDTVNVFFTDYVLELIKSNNTQLLAPYLIRA